MFWPPVVSNRLFKANQLQTTTSKRGVLFNLSKFPSFSEEKNFYIFHNLGKDLRDNLIGQGLLIFGNILKQKFADIQGNWWKILRNIGWSIYTTKAFWQHFPLMRWKKFCHISKICLKLLIKLMLQKKIKSSWCCEEKNGLL